MAGTVSGPGVYGWRGSTPTGLGENPRTSGHQQKFSEAVVIGATGYARIASCLAGVDQPLVLNHFLE